MIKYKRTVWKIKNSIGFTRLKPIKTGYENVRWNVYIRKDQTPKSFTILLQEADKETEETQDRRNY